MAAHPVLGERDLRARNHSGALVRSTSMGCSACAIRAHTAERALRREHEGLLSTWAQARLGLGRAVVAAEALQMVLGFGFASWLLLAHLGRQGPDGTTLLIVYWALSLPVLGQDIALLARNLPTQRSVLLRLLEPLDAAAPETPAVAEPPACSGPGVGSSCAARASSWPARPC